MLLCDFSGERLLSLLINLIRKLYSILIVSFRSVYTLSVFFFILLVFSFT